MRGLSAPPAGAARRGTTDRRRHMRCARCVDPLLHVRSAAPPALQEWEGAGRPRRTLCVRIPAPPILRGSQEKAPLNGYEHADRIGCGREGGRGAEGGGRQREATPCTFSTAFGLHAAQPNMSPHKCNLCVLIQNFYPPCYTACLQVFIPQKISYLDREIFVLSHFLRLVPNVFAPIASGQITIFAQSPGRVLPACGLYSAVPPPAHEFLPIIRRFAIEFESARGRKKKADSDAREHILIRQSSKQRVYENCPHEAYRRIKNHPCFFFRRG